jgi:enterochelin esterase-like enzyme
MYANRDNTDERLKFVRDLFEAADGKSAQLRQLLPRFFPQLDAEGTGIPSGVYQDGESLPSLGGSGTAVWHHSALFVVSSTSTPELMLNAEAPQPMCRVPETSYWFVTARIEPGRLHTYRYCIDGKCGPGSDVAGYKELSYPITQARRGTLIDRRVVRSNHSYPGADTEYWIYVNAGVDEQRGAPVMIWHDGETLLEPQDHFGLRLQIVSDNLTHLGLIPPMAHVFVSPSRGPINLLDELPSEVVAASRSMRALQYGMVTRRYGCHLLQEVLPDAQRVVKLRSDGYSRGSAGASWGGTAAVVLGLFHSKSFGRVLSMVGAIPAASDVRLSDIVRREAKRNIRVWLDSGSNDLEVRDSWPLPAAYVLGGLPINNVLLANAFKAHGYDFRFRFGDGYHSTSQGALDLPDALTWLWRDYDAERKGQVFGQSEEERSQPIFRVRITNRET